MTTGACFGGSGADSFGGGGVALFALGGVGATLIAGLGVSAGAGSGAAGLEASTSTITSSTGGETGVGSAAPRAARVATATAAPCNSREQAMKIGSTALRDGPWCRTASIQATSMTYGDCPAAASF